MAKKLSKTAKLLAEIELLTKQRDFCRSQRKAFQTAMSEFMEGIFVSADEAETIAHDAVSERIW